MCINVCTQGGGNMILLTRSSGPQPSLDTWCTFTRLPSPPFAPRSSTATMSTALFSTAKAQAKGVPTRMHARVVSVCFVVRCSINT